MTPSSASSGPAPRRSAGAPVVVLKGARTVVAAPDGRVACAHSPTRPWPPVARATCWRASSARCWPRACPPWEAACLGVHLHGDRRPSTSGSGWAMRVCWRPTCCRSCPRVRRELRAPAVEQPERRRSASPPPVDRSTSGCGPRGLPPLTRPMWLEIDVDALAGNAGRHPRSVSAPGRPCGRWSRRTPTATAWRWRRGRSWRPAPTALCVATARRGAGAPVRAGVAGPVLILYPVPAGDRRGRRLAWASSSPSSTSRERSRWPTAGCGSAARRHAAAAPAASTSRSRPGSRGWVSRRRGRRRLERCGVPGPAASPRVWSHLATPEDPRMSERPGAAPRRVRSRHAALAGVRTPASATWPRPVGCSPGAVAGAGHGAARPHRLRGAAPTTPERAAAAAAVLRPAMRLVHARCASRRARRDTPWATAGRWVAARDRRASRRCPWATAMATRGRPVRAPVLGRGPSGARRGGRGDGRADGRCDRCAGCRTRPMRSCSWAPRETMPIDALELARRAPRSRGRC